MSSQKIKYFKNFKYCFFTRNGGVSNKNFSSLNCAFNEEENPKNVIKNREIVKKDVYGCFFLYIYFWVI